MNAVVVAVSPLVIAPVVAPPYSLDHVAFSAPALAEAAGAAQLGGDRELSIASFMAARLVLASLPPEPLSAEERMLRAERARQWLSALTMPQPARMALIRAIDASAASGLDAAASLRELAQMLTGHLPAPALRELAVLAERVRLYYEQTP